MGDDFGPDFISDLPEIIIDSILSRLPIRDAIRTSILSSKWRYKWTYITELVFDDNCVDCVDFDDEDLVEEYRVGFVRFITSTLFIHQGPIHKFQAISTHLECCPDVDLWIRFLSRKDVKDLVIDLGYCCGVPSCLFNFKKLTYLELDWCKFEPPISFKGFLCLRKISFWFVQVSAEGMERLISSCPLLESLELLYFDRLALNICAPNLKYLHLEEDKSMNVFLANTPLLKSLKVKIYKYDDIAEYNEQSPTSNFIKLLGRVPHLEKLVGDIDFVKYLSIGNDPGILPVTYDNLKIIELYQVSFEDMKELLFVLRLIMNAPNLTELHLSGRKNTLTVVEAPDLDFWKQKYPLNCTLKQLKVAKMTKMSGLPPEMEFIKFLLANSPVLKMMSIALFSDFVDGILCMSIELLRFRRASAQAEILFVQEDQDDPVP